MATSPATITVRADTGTLDVHLSYSKPLPECLLCERPMRRTPEAVGTGLCGSCRVSSTGDATARAQGAPRDAR